jgi:hypothetical protein
MMTQQWYQSRWFDEGFDRLLGSKVFLTKVVRWRGGQVAWRKLPLDGEHIQEWMNSHLRGRLLWQV